LPFVSLAQGLAFDVIAEQRADQRIGEFSKIAQVRA
jgi:hypothetical protein